MAGTDIDTIQKAKRACAAAMEALLELAGLGWSDVRRLCVCGAFGHTLNLANAQAVGLLPTLDPSQVELQGSASLAGCELLLLNPQGTSVLDQLVTRTRIVNLSLLPNYDDKYINHLRLQPLRRNP